MQIIGSEYTVEWLKVNPPFVSLEVLCPTSS